eukprot:5230730-Amphidinium_carterae.1
MFLLFCNDVTIIVFMFCCTLADHSRMLNVNSQLSQTLWALELRQNSLQTIFQFFGITVFSLQMIRMCILGQNREKLSRSQAPSSGQEL